MGESIHCDPDKGKSHSDTSKCKTDCDPNNAKSHEVNKCDQNQSKSHCEAINLDSNKATKQKSAARDQNNDQSQTSRGEPRRGVCYKNLDNLNFTVTVDTKKTNNDEALDGDKKTDDPYSMLFF
ncbi:unnamed protein product [Pieris brassicae]|uniref:Uncharacterized protein n=1 Tax=Pieris brassicae TaxID=7116 RepID=A0A9P0TVB0_PIEBR|nr:unnamed protein product [Pieris brassicae]